jgi:hypothetical protein
MGERFSVGQKNMQSNQIMKILQMNGQKEIKLDASYIEKKNLKNHKPEKLTNKFGLN